MIVSLYIFLYDNTLIVPMFCFLGISFSSMFKLSVINLGFGHCAFKSHSNTSI